MSRRGLLIGGATAAVALAVGGTGLAYYLHSRPVPRPAAKPAPGPHRLIAGIPLLRLHGHTGTVWDVAWHPSGRYLATGSDDTSVIIWQVDGA